MKKDTKVKIHRFWIPAPTSIGVSRDRLFVAKADYARVMKRNKELENIIDRLNGINNATTEAALFPVIGSRVFRSACSGLWYQNPRSAGDIDAVELYGQRLIRYEDETPLAWIHRVAEWSAKLHSENR